MEAARLIASWPMSKDKDALRERLVREFKIYIAGENLGKCKVCGETKDLRYGYCMRCAPDGIKKKLGDLMTQAETTIVLTGGDQT